MKSKGLDTEQSQLHRMGEALLAIGAMALLFLLFASCAGLPFLIGRTFGDWSGLLSALTGIIGWVWLAPLRGFLQAILALSGLCALAGLMIFWIVTVIKHG
ncbi:MAG: hypothetical protein EOP86_27710 [Verrucomicrobiaceae bacterium]|nr:MAG: hypothetical protein EOP86_27710 [Verrucomicrobiaceae bacterium]